MAATDHDDNPGGCGVKTMSESTFLDSRTGLLQGQTVMTIYGLMDPLAHLTHFAWHLDHQPRL